MAHCLHRASLRLTLRSDTGGGRNGRDPARPDEVRLRGKPLIIHLYRANLLMCQGSRSTTSSVWLVFWSLARTQTKSSSESATTWTTTMKSWSSLRTHPKSPISKGWLDTSLLKSRELQNSRSSGKIKPLYCSRWRWTTTRWTWCNSNSRRAACNRALSSRTAMIWWALPICKRQQDSSEGHLNEIIIAVKTLYIFFHMVLV